VPKEGDPAKRPDASGLGGRLMTILRQFARELAESANASGRKFSLEKSDAVRKMGYFLRFVRTSSTAFAALCCSEGVT